MPRVRPDLNSSGTEDRTVLNLRSVRPRSTAALGLLSVGLVALAVTADARADDPPYVVLKGKADAPGSGKRVVLISGDEEYRSEEALPQLAKILSLRHGFDCTVLFAVGQDGTIDPNRNDNIPGLEALRTADLMVIFTRYRNLPPAQMKEVVDYLDSGRPVVGLRTATHAFNIKPGQPYEEYSAGGKTPTGGFGRTVLGETWVAHHGSHGRQSTRGLIAPGAARHPILRGIKDGEIWGPTDVYAVTLPLPGDSEPLVLGQVLKGMDPSYPPAADGKLNDPMMPVAWVKTYSGKSNRPGRVFTTTMGASQDFANEGLRRLVVNACYWATGLEGAIPEASDVAPVGEYRPTPFGFNAHRRGVRPSETAR